KPPLELIHKMGAFIEEHAKAGRFLDGGGLAGSKARTRLTFQDGRATVKHGPYRGERESPAALLTLKVRTRDEAIGWAERYGKILGDGEIELGKLNEAWDIGLMPEPENAPLQFLLIEKADAATEAGGRSAKQKAELTRLKSEMTKAGVLVKSLRLHPSATAKRLMFRNNDLQVIDGPFSESKELIGGFSIMELANMDEVIALCRAYGEILGGTLEIDVRTVDTTES
ncbi:MAG: YciI family protein, partial [Polyangia bacterium]